MRISVFLPDNVDLTSIIHHIYAYTQYAILKFAQKIRPLQGFLEVQVSKTRVFAGSGILSALLSPLPCLAASVAGIVCARHSVKAGNKKARKFFIIGIIAATVSVMETLLTVTLLYMSISV